MKMIDYNISYFASEFEIFDPLTALMFLIGLWVRSYLLTTFQVPLVQVPLVQVPLVQVRSDD